MAFDGFLFKNTVFGGKEFQTNNVSQQTYEWILSIVSPGWKILQNILNQVLLSLNNYTTYGFSIGLK